MYYESCFYIYSIKDYIKSSSIIYIPMYLAVLLFNLLYPGVIKLTFYYKELLILIVL